MYQLETAGQGADLMPRRKGRFWHHLTESRSHCQRTGLHFWNHFVLSLAFWLLILFEETLAVSERGLPNFNRFFKLIGASPRRV
jgi:hypothetical protein